MLFDGFCVKPKHFTIFVHLLLIVKCDLAYKIELKITFLKYYLFILSIKMILLEYQTQDRMAITADFKTHEPFHEYSILNFFIHRIHAQPNSRI